MAHPEKNERSKFRKFVETKLPRGNERVSPVFGLMGLVGGEFLGEIVGSYFVLRHFPQITRQDITLYYTTIHFCSILSTYYAGTRFGKIFEH